MCDIILLYIASRQVMCDIILLHAMFVFAIYSVRKPGGEKWLGREEA